MGMRRLLVATDDSPHGDHAVCIGEESGIVEPGRGVVNVGALGRPANDGRTSVWFTVMTAAASGPEVEFVHEVTAWAKEYQVPTFTRDVKTLIKLKAFLSAKLA